MYRNGLKTIVISKKRALRKIIDSKTKELKNRFNYGL